MELTRKAIELIKRHEGLRLKAYKCPAGVWTVGYGHTGADVRAGMVITPAEAEGLLVSDLAKAVDAVRLRVKTELTDNQFGALVSFVYNAGAGNFGSSTLLRKVNADPNDETIRGEFARWVYGGGAKLPGLVKRRIAEANLYFDKR